MKRVTTAVLLVLALVLMNTGAVFAADEDVITEDAEVEVTAEAVESEEESPDTEPAAEPPEMTEDSEGSDEPEVILEDPEDTDVPADTDEPEEGEKTIYTYKLSIEKVDENGYELDGAEFELYDAATGGNRIYVTESDEGYIVTKDQDLIDEDIKIAAGTTVVDGLDADITYYLEEVNAPDGYNKINGRIEVKAELSGTTTEHYKKATEYNPETPYFIKDGGDYIPVDDVSEADFNAGTYYVYVGEETTTEASIPAFPKASIVNKAGAELPETGGIGTTIFYMIGTILVLGAGVLLITRRRMNQ